MNLLMLVLLLGVIAAPPAFAQTKQPNVLIIWGDDVGYWNVSAYNQGMMGYRTPNIDRIAREGGLFTDSGGARRDRRGGSSRTGRSCNRAP